MRESVDYAELGLPPQELAKIKELDFMYGG